MAHNIQAGQPHSILNIKLAMHGTEPNSIADELNELFRDALGYSSVADYMFAHSDNPAIIHATDDPAEGELFEAHRTYCACIINDTSTTWVKIESTLPLCDYDSIQLRRIVSRIYPVGTCDRILLGQLETMQRAFVSL